MSDLLIVAVTWWLVSLSGIVMPGPVTAMAVSQGARLGGVAGPLVTAGDAIAEVFRVALGLLWWATVGAGYDALFSARGVAAVVGLFCAGHIALDLAWNSVLAGVVGAGRGRMHPGAYRALLLGCGLPVVGSGVWCVATGARFLGL